MKSTFALFSTFILLSSCQGQQTTPDQVEQELINSDTKEIPDKVATYFMEHSDTLKSTSLGSVSNGKLEHASLVPFSGSNYTYFDTSSYLSGRAFTHSSVAGIILDSYEELKNQGCPQKFQLMELSNQHGGKIFPHRTHQNGKSADFMMPLMTSDGPCYKYDSLGVGHYLMDFDDNGRVVKDSIVSINFNTVAQHILLLDELARKRGMKIAKVIINTNLKDELFATAYGQKLRKSNIYVVRRLEPLINDLHDDHYHIDFEFL